MTIMVINYKEMNYQKAYAWYVKQCSVQWLDPVDYETYVELVPYYKVLQLIEFYNL